VNRLIHNISINNGFAIHLWMIRIGLLLSVFAITPYDDNIQKFIPESTKTELLFSLESESVYFSTTTQENQLRTDELSCEQSSDNSEQTALFIYNKTVKIQYERMADNYLSYSWSLYNINNKIGQIKTCPVEEIFIKRLA
jgi:hypothetical protein